MLAVFTLFTGCESKEIAARNEIARERIWKGEKSHVVRYPWQEQLDAGALNTNSEQLKRVLSMSMEELAHRLPSFTATADLNMLFNRAARRYTQESKMTLAVDSKANFHFTQGNGWDGQKFRDDVEYILKDDTLYVRYVNGPFRLKEALNQPVDKLRELYAKSIWESFEPWLKFLKLSSPELMSADGRTAYRYNISLQIPGDSEKPIVDDGNTDPALWREKSWPTDIRGFITVDSDTAALLAATLEVKADIMDKKPQPTIMQYTMHHQLSDVLKTMAVEVPEKAIEEYTVVKNFRGGKYRRQDEMPEKDENSPKRETDE